MKQVVLSVSMLWLGITSCMQQPATTAAEALRVDPTDLESLLDILPDLPPATGMGAFVTAAVSHVVTIHTVETVARDIKARVLTKVGAKEADVIPRVLRKYFEDNASIDDDGLQYTCATIVLAFLKKHNFQMSRELALLIQKQLDARQTRYEKKASNDLEMIRKQALLAQQMRHIVHGSAHLDRSVSPIPGYAESSAFFETLTRHGHFGRR